MVAFEMRAKEHASHEMGELNRTRKATHLHLGDKISTYESRWRDLVSRNLSIRVATLTTRANMQEIVQRTEDMKRELASMDAAQV